MLESRKLCLSALLSLSSSSSQDGGRANLSARFLALPYLAKFGQGWARSLPRRALNSSIPFICQHLPLPRTMGVCASCLGSGRQDSADDVRMLSPVSLEHARLPAAPYSPPKLHFFTAILTITAPRTMTPRAASSTRRPSDAPRTRSTRYAQRRSSMPCPGTRLSSHSHSSH